LITLEAPKAAISKSLIWGHNMIKFNKPANLNGKELLAQLKTQNVEVTGFPFIDDEDSLWLDIANKDQEKAEAVISAHNGTQIAPEPTIAEKLASVGLSIEELKAALA
jgi:hypothetical protein